MPVIAKMEKFEFDEWAELYRADPAAFEARRLAMLALELARVDPLVAGPARAALQRLEAQLDGKSEEERLRTSMIWMLASMRLLSARMRDLGDRVGTGDRMIPV